MIQTLVMAIKLLSLSAIHLTRDMRIFYTLLLFCLLSCTSDSQKTEKTTATATSPAPVTQEETVDIPRSSGCAFLTDEQIITAITGTADGATISTQPGRTVSACYYRLENMRWSGDFVVEVLDSQDAANVIKDVKAAPEAEKLTIDGHPAQILQGNRILRVASAPPFEMKLSILPKSGYKEFADDTDRKRILTELAQILAKR